ncbi:MAG: RnfABCDGE type electron transport complex subunit D [Planctomycetes bacterium]|nr:RnfABCDGE type electron transport complex subunit D [Planctomycetota bacterium]
MAQGKIEGVFLRKQTVMRRVTGACLPCVFGGVYFFGWRVLAVAIVSCVAGLLTEYAFCRKRGEPATESVFVTSLIYSLILPPGVPWHVVVIGIVFAVVFAKEVFGGFGRNIFNPAMVGRCFVYICFPVAMTGRWPVSAPVSGIGALGQWSTAAVADAITSATPLAIMKTEGVVPELSSLLFGGISGTAGVTSAALILIGGMYLYYTKTASRLIILSTVISYAVINQFFTWMGNDTFHGALPALLGGGFLFGAFFMATDPISAPKTKQGKLIYGVMIAVFTAVIRNYSIFNGGLMFSILLANMFGPITDYAVGAWGTRKKIEAAGEGSS